LALCLAGCDRPLVMEITHTRVATVPPRPASVTAKSSDRFPSPFAMAPGHGGGPSDTAPAEPFAFAAPPGWSRVAPNSMRLVNMKVGDAECYVAHLPGAAGGTLANVNRWRNQLSLDAIGGDELATLPNQEVLGRTAVVVELTGTLDGEADRGILGVILPYTVRGVVGTLFVKMVGASALLSSERANFDAFCASLAPKTADPHAGHNHPPGEGHGEEPKPDPHAGHSAGSARPPKLTWTGPDGWTQAPPRSMREVTFFVGDDVECYISLLSGLAGGLKLNVNRWRDQVGQGPLDDEGVVALPKTTMLGRDARVVEATGTYTGMDDVAHPSWGLLGAICELDDAMVFVKMLGPAEKVAAAREAFVAFCGSMELSK
jgi:hypothetical protein